MARFFSLFGSPMPAIYALLGVIIGGWISWRNQHRQWVKDNKAREYRELIDGLFTSTENILQARPNAESPITDPLADAVWNGTRLTQNRIFTLCAIKDAGVDEDWQKISNLALWNPGELKIKVKGSELVTRTALSSILRKDLENKLSALAQRDLKV